jgi:hypothetical protein
MIINDDMGRYCDGRGDGREANGEDTSELPPFGYYFPFACLNSAL